MGEASNGRVANVAMVGVLVIATSLGVRGVLSSSAKAFARPDWNAAGPIAVATVLALAALALWWWRERRS